MSSAPRLPPIPCPSTEPDWTGRRSAILRISPILLAATAAFNQVERSCGKAPHRPFDSLPNCRSPTSRRLTNHRPGLDRSTDTAAVPLVRRAALPFSRPGSLNDDNNSSHSEFPATLGRYGATELAPRRPAHALCGRKIDRTARGRSKSAESDRDSRGTAQTVSAVSAECRGTDMANGTNMPAEVDYRRERFDCAVGFRRSQRG